MSNYRKDQGRENKSTLCFGDFVFVEKITGIVCVSKQWLQHGHLWESFTWTKDTEIVVLDTEMIKQPQQNYSSSKTNNLLLDMDFCGDSDMTLPLLASGGAVSSDNLCVHY